jgi:hypothetical protein
MTDTYSSFINSLDKDHITILKVDTLRSDIDLFSDVVSLEDYKPYLDRNIQHRIIVRIEDHIDNYTIDVFQYDRKLNKTLWNMLNVQKFTRFSLSSSWSSNHLVSGSLWFDDDKSGIELLPTSPDVIFYLQQNLFIPLS